MSKVQQATAVTSFKREAEAFSKVADILQGRPKEEACAIMAGVCACLGFYDEAQRFIDLARLWRHVADDAALAEAERELGATT